MGWIAIILICANSLAASDCTEQTALDVLTISVDNELRCSFGWEDVIARSAYGRDVGTTAYIRTKCRRAVVNDGPPVKPN